MTDSCERGLAADRLTLGYAGRVVVTRLSLRIPTGRLTTVVGPNACGKSTLLRALARLLEPTAGRVLLDGRPLGTMRPKEVARQIGYLPQDPVTPDGIKVAKLVARGRYPHQNLLGTWSVADQEAVESAMAAAGIGDLAARPVEELSGGQRQRVWIAMVLAQQTPYLLLDEPTSFLDIAHQYELLRLLVRLREEGRTVVAVLHDINQASRFADHVVAMKHGAVIACGAPREVIDAPLIERVFGLTGVVVPDPVAGTPMVVPALD